jgi:hypothetical protein
MCFEFIYDFVWNIRVSYSKKNWERYGKKFVLVFMCSSLYSSQVLIKLYFFDRFSKNIWIQNFTKLGPVGNELFHADGRTDGHD